MQIFLQNAGIFAQHIYVITNKCNQLKVTFGPIQEKLE